MNCSQCRDSITRAHLRQEELSASVRTHIGTCRDCRRILEASEGLEALLRSPTAEHQPSADLHRRIIDSIDNGTRISASIFSRPAHLAIAACLLLALGATIYINQFRPQDAIQARSPDDPISRILASEQNPDMLLVSASQAMTEAIGQEMQLFQDDLKSAARFCGAMLSMSGE